MSGPLCAPTSRIRVASLGGDQRSFFPMSIRVAPWGAGVDLRGNLGGVFQVREDEPTPRLGATLHRTP